MGLKEIPVFDRATGCPGITTIGGPLAPTTKWRHPGCRLLRNRNSLFRNPLVWIALTSSLLISGFSPSSARSQQALFASSQSRPISQSQENRDATCKIIYLGIVGGTEPSNNPHSGVVQIRKILQGSAYPDVCAKSYTP